MNVGKWIRVKHKNIQTIGYIVFEDHSRIEMQPTKPYGKDSIRIYKFDTKYIIVELELDNKMIDLMIDISLDIKDEKWFYELMEMRSR